MYSGLVLMTFSVFASGMAFAQTGADVTTGSMVTDNASLAGPGPITASPQDTITRSEAQTAPSRRTARLLGNGASPNDGQSGANALGNTGGLTTGPKGGAAVTARGMSRTKPQAGRRGNSELDNRAADERDRQENRAAPSK